jgi:hypothetical protein
LDTTLGFHEKRAIVKVAEKLTASQDGLFFHGVGYVKGIVSLLL